MEILFRERGNAGEINCLGIKRTVLLVQFEMPIIYSDADTE